VKPGGSFDPIDRARVLGDDGVLVIDLVYRAAEPREVLALGFAKVTGNWQAEKHLFLSQGAIEFERVDGPAEMDDKPLIPPNALIHRDLEFGSLRCLLLHVILQRTAYARGRVFAVQYGAYSVM